MSSNNRNPPRKHNFPAKKESKFQFTESESQLVLRLPPHLAEKMGNMVRKHEISGVDFQQTGCHLFNLVFSVLNLLLSLEGGTEGDGRDYTFTFDGIDYPARLGAVSFDVIHPTTQMQTRAHTTLIYTSNSTPANFIFYSIPFISHHRPCIPSPS